jgi:hypothetical protein
MYNALSDRVKLGRIKHEYAEHAICAYVYIPMSSEARCRPIFMTDVAAGPFPRPFQML